MRFGKSTSITEAIHELYQQYEKEYDWVKSPKDINTGECGEFAHQICLRVSGAMIATAPGHTFVLFENRFYDSEAPEGVEHVRDLPFFVRNHGKYLGSDEERQAREEQLRQAARAA